MLTAYRTAHSSNLRLWQDIKPPLPLILTLSEVNQSGLRSVDHVLMPMEGTSMEGEVECVAVVVAQTAVDQTINPAEDAVAVAVATPNAEEAVLSLQGVVAHRDPT